MSTAIDTADRHQAVDRARAELATIPPTPGVDDYLRAWSEWCLALAASPEQQLALAQSAARAAIDNWRFAFEATQALTDGSAAAHANDAAQFAGPAWNYWPFNIYAHGYAQLSKWSQQALALAPQHGP